MHGECDEMSGSRQLLSPAGGHIVSVIGVAGRPTSSAGEC